MSHHVIEKLEARRSTYRRQSFLHCLLAQNKLKYRSKSLNILGTCLNGYTAGKPAVPVRWVRFAA